MAKGNIAKENIAKKLQEIYGKNYLGEVDKKLYVIEDDGGSTVQIAISLTCPKTEVESGTKPANNEGWDFSDPSPVPEVKKVTEMTKEELDKIEELMKKFDL